MLQKAIDDLGEIRSGGDDLYQAEKAFLVLFLQSVIQHPSERGAELVEIILRK